MAVALLLSHCRSSWIGAAVACIVFAVLSIVGVITLRGLRRKKHELVVGGVVTVLQTWQIDWHETLGWLHPRWEGGPQRQLDATVAALRINLGWAAERHPAWSEFAAEVRQLVTACRTQVTGERTERRITVVCTADGCGGLMRVTVSTPGVRCGRCGTQYDRTEALRLPVAARSVAA